MRNLNDFETAIVLALRNTSPLTVADIERKARQLAPVFELDDYPVEQIIRSVETKLVTTMSEGISLVDQSVRHDDEWHEKKEIQWDYWSDYESHLKSEGWGPHVVSTMGDVTGKILGLLKNPEDAGDWKRRGLVIGHVQSGKTANYIGLISKAADAGYKFIIVIAGIHNNLRTQTQQRVDEGFIGRNSDPNRRGQMIGVGLNHPNRRFPVTLTTTGKDFDRNIANQLGADLQVYRQPVVVVIKKNVSTLKNLYAWLKEWNTREAADKIGNIPMLMIDDEADNASINTKKDDINPTETNKQIRNVLSLFRKSCYVGYTATPFANIFINPDTEDEMLGHDLFPRDFIYCLDAPTNYFGPQKVFIDEESSQAILRTIDDAEDIVPLKHRKDHPVSELPLSLKKAINTFVIGKAIRVVREHGDKHASMMVNASRFVDVQRQLREHISLYVKEMKNAVMLHYALPEDKALKDAHMRALREIFDEEFSAGSETWQDIQKVLYEAVDAIKIFVVNSKSDEALDYRWAEENEESLTALAIGGLSLSRGLTLEGLMVSYMYRNTQMYDTLMQMGRWFGYRTGYVDLCRVWLPAESQGWYSHIADATDELRQQIKQMRRDRRSPVDFGLYVRAHPDALLVTALNKMRDAERRPFRINLSGTLTETFVVPSDAGIVSKNQELMKKLFAELQQQYPEQRKPVGNSYFWAGVDWEQAEKFLMEFNFHHQIQNKKIAVLDYLRKISDKYPTVDIAFISLEKPKPSTTGFQISNTDVMYCQERAVGISSTGSIREPLEEAGYYVTNKQRVASRGAESIGLGDDLRKKAEATAEEDGMNIADKYYRQMRPRPLLMLHVVKLAHRIKEKNFEEPLMDQVPAMGISFPGGDYLVTVDYVVNKVWLKQMEEESFENPDEDQDYDN
ncbi:MAG: Z1 domain-containing protein [Burkholderiales bacterium]|nr:Z1 domain-containing protein [Burkholderiales bacterium]